VHTKHVREIEADRGTWRQRETAGHRETARQRKGETKIDSEIEREREKLVDAHTKNLVAPNSRFGVL